MAHPIYQAQDNLKALLAARPAWANAAITDGGPTEGEDVRYDQFWFNDVINVSDGWAEVGARRRRVRFQLGFTIAVRKYGDDERSARVQALDYFQDFCDAIKSDYSLGGVIQQTENVTGTVGSAPTAPQEWGAWFTGTLDVISKSY